MSSRFFTRSPLPYVITNLQTNVAERIVEDKKRLPVPFTGQSFDYQVVCSPTYSLDSSLSDLILPWGCCSCLRDFQAASFLLFW